MNLNEIQKKKEEILDTIMYLFAKACYRFCIYHIKFDYVYLEHSQNIFGYNLNILDGN